MRACVRAVRCEEESVERALPVRESLVNVKTALVNPSEVPCYMPAGCTRHSILSATSKTNPSRFTDYCTSIFLYKFLVLHAGYCTTSRVLDFLYIAGLLIIKSQCTQ